MQEFYLYLARFLSACCIYLFIAKANIWLDKVDNTLLVFGYRFFILLAPLFFMLTKRWLPAFSFAVAALGVLCWLNQYNLIGTILFSSGIAVGSYAIKYYAVKTPQGAAYNAIIFNLGVFLSGLLIILLPHNNFFLKLGFVLILITLASAFLIREQSKNSTQNSKANFSFAALKSFRGIAWAMVGLVCGIELIGMFSILPQYLISHYKILPNWYGWLIQISTLTIVLFQKPIMNLVQRFNLKHNLYVLTISMFIVAFPGIFACEYFLGAAIWVFMLTLFECVIAYLDTLSVKEDALLVKECFVGIGMALTVFTARSFAPLKAAFVMGALGFCLMLIAIPVLLIKRINSLEIEKTAG